MEKKTIVFITGAFVSHLGWADWQAYFEKKGYSTLAPPWPFKDGDPCVLRKKKHQVGLAQLTLAGLVDHFTNIVNGFPEKPIVIGHSLGGLVVQLLVNKDLVSAGVAIHPVPPQSVIPYEFSFLKSAWKSLGLFTSLNKPYLMSLKDFKYAFVNDMPVAEQEKAYNEQVVPESKRVSRGALTNAAKVNFRKSHPPLLITSGSIDHIIPASLNLRNFNRYRNGDSVMHYKEFPGRNHFVLGQPTWQEDAEYIINWLNNYHS